MVTIPLSQAKAQLAKLLKETQELGEQVLITRSGRPAGMLVPVDEFEGMQETLEILADSELAESLARGLEDAAAGRLIEHDELWDALEDPIHD